MKIDDYNLSKLSVELENFKEDVQNILNFGKYSAQVVTAAPTWAARNGEYVFFNSASTVNRIYLRLNTAWTQLDFSQVANGYIVFSGTDTTEILDSFNVTSLSRPATGDFVVTWTTPFARSPYASAGINGGAMVGGVGWVCLSETTMPTVSQVAFWTRNAAGLLTNAPISALISMGALSAS